MSLTSQAALQITPREANDERRLHFYGKGEDIPLVTLGVWQVYKGLVQMSTLSQNGEEVLLGWAGAGNFFGHWLFQSFKKLPSHGQPNLYISYRALSDVYLKWYSIDEIEASPRLSQIMLPQLVRRIRQVETLLTIKGQKRVEERLQYLLLLLKQEMGQPVPEGTCIKARLTHQHLANAINTTRVTITRLLNDFKRQGWIALDGNRHIILKDGHFPSVSDW